MGELHHFLVIFDASRGELVETVEFVDRDEADRAFAQAEAKNRHEGGYQVVMFTARSIENVKSTHPHYFRAVDDEDTSGFLIPA